MMDLPAIERALKDRNLQRVSEGSGVSYPTVWKVARGHGENVRYVTVKALSDYLSRKS